MYAWGRRYVLECYVFRQKCTNTIIFRSINTNTLSAPVPERGISNTHTRARATSGPTWNRRQGQVAAARTPAPLRQLTRLSPHSAGGGQTSERENEGQESRVSLAVRGVHWKSDIWSPSHGTT